MNANSFELLSFNYTRHRNIIIYNRLLVTITCNFKDMMLDLYQLYNSFVS